mmetsp:Transcript_18535/g.23590  ORF Transcript_18535/g.23590 Transcript_18535/m.23590 type:complete len:324 (-) Transcript_18535:684-1655(-)
MTLSACVIGCGSLGLYFGHRLSTSGAHVTLVKRAPISNAHGAAAIKLSARRQIIQLRGKTPQSTLTKTEVTVTDGLAGLSNCAEPIELPFGIILVTVKHKDTEEVGKQIYNGFNSGFFSPSTIVVSLQNGMGNVEILREQLQGESHLMPVFQGLTYTGVSRPEEYMAQINGLGKTFVGIPNPQENHEMLLTKDVSGILEELASRLDVTFTDGIDSMMWTKLLVNTIINPITSLLDLPNGSVATEKRFQGILSSACKEFEKVARKEKVDLQLGDETAAEFVIRVATNTNSNISSMLNDVREGNQTEIEALNGYIIRRGTYVFTI